MLRSPSDQALSLILRNEATLWSPRVVEEGKTHQYKINLEAEKQVRGDCIHNDCRLVSHLIPSFFSLQEYKPIGTGHNRKAQPFIAANIDDRRQVVSTAYNTPIGLYSSGNIQDAMEGQIRGLAPHRPEG